MTNEHPFEIGGRYRNRDGDYTVIAIDGETMAARYDDGREQALNVATRCNPSHSFILPNHPPIATYPPALA